MVGWQRNGCVLWLFLGVWWCVRASIPAQSLAMYVACTKCVQVSLSETFAWHVFMQLGCTQYETHKFLRRHVQRKSVARFHATLLRCTCTNLHGACTELAHKLVKFCTNLHTLIFWHLSKKIHSHQISTDTQNSHLLHNPKHTTQNITRLSPPPLPFLPLPPRPATATTSASALPIPRRQ
jgi:hypothetical protein